VSILDLSAVLTEGLPSFFSFFFPSPLLLLLLLALLLLKISPGVSGKYFSLDLSVSP
jgi:hypothetical protein